MLKQGNAKKFKKAFTLAEVLIVMGIIGIVAELCIPDLISNVRRQEASAALKTFYNDMTQATMISETNNGPMDDWDYHGDASAYLQEYVLPYLNYRKVDYGASVVYLRNGSSFSYGSGGCVDVQYDTNGDKKPNIYGKDKFVFLLCRGADATSWGGTFVPYGLGNSISTDLQRCKDSPYSCSSLLMQDEFDFKDDYPYAF